MLQKVIHVFFKNKVCFLCSRGFEICQLFFFVFPNSQLPVCLHVIDNLILQLLKVLLPM